VSATTAERRLRWEEIIRTHSSMVYRLAYRLTGDPYDAEDLTQETFLRVYQHLDSFRSGSFEGWIRRITTNLFFDQARRAARVRFDALDWETDRAVDPDLDPERRYHHLHLDHDMQSALDSLSPDFRAVVVLCDIEGRTYEEIAQILDLKVGTVRSRIHRARAQLRGELTDAGQDELVRSA
jgi:RNA polymerase sigma-70 factor (ECF subfamily)